MHPGVIATTLLHEMFRAGGDRPEHAASNILQGYPAARITAHTTTNGGRRSPIPPPWTQSPKIGSTTSPPLRWRLSCRESDKSVPARPLTQTKQLPHRIRQRSCGRPYLQEWRAAEGPPDRSTLYGTHGIVPADGSAPIRFATRDGNSFLTGGLDEVAIYPRVLTGAEIMENYTAGIS
jgi:hypothetical protein